MAQHHSIFNQPIAHRGLWNVQRPENSLTAFHAACDAGYGIELDVQMTADDVPVVFHDYDTVRMTDKKGGVSQQTCEELRQMRLAGTEERMPTLTEALELIDGRVPVLIEVKGRGLGLRIVRAVEKIITNYNGDVVVSSFNPLIVRWCRMLMPETLCGQNFKNFISFGPVRGLLTKQGLRLVWRVAGVVPDFFVIKANALPNTGIMDLAKKYEKPLLTWAPDTRAEYNRVQQYTDNVIFEKMTP